MKTFTVNGNTYIAKDLDFNFATDNFDSMSNPLAIARAYLAYCGNMSYQKAAKELEQHIITNKNFGDIITVYTEMMNESDFFRALLETAKENDGTDQTEETEETLKTVTKKSKAKA